MWTSWVWVFVWSEQDRLVIASNSSPVLLGADCQKPPSLTRGIRMALGKGPPPPRLHGNRCQRFVFRVVSGKERTRVPLPKPFALGAIFSGSLDCEGMFHLNSLYLYLGDRTEPRSGPVRYTPTGRLPQCPPGTAQ